MNMPTAQDVSTAVQRAQAANTDQRFWHRHHWVEFFYDIRADEPGGPRSYHGIGWACRCGNIADCASQP